MEKLEVIAQAIYDAELSKKPFPPIRTNFSGERDIESAYKIQHFITQKKIQDGAKLIGKKIGLTSFAVQKQLGVNEPDFGVLTDKMQFKNHAEIPFTNLMQPKAEAEWAFILKEDLDVDHLDMESIKNAIDHARVAIEIVGSRIEDWNIRITDTIADNASASHFVLGDEKIDMSSIDLENCQMKMFKNGDLVSEGTGKACMGNPLKAVLWLAHTMKKHQNPLIAGDVILSGALGPMTNIERGDSLKAIIDGYEEVSFKVV